MTFPNDRTYSFDINLLLSDNAAAYTATGYSQVGGANAILDLGGNQGTSPVELARVDCVAVIDVTAIKTSSSNETYKMIALVSNDPNFGAGNVVMAGEIEVGYGASLDGIDMATSTTGRYELMFSNQIAGQIYEYAALYLQIGGTTPTISISAFLAVLPEC